MSVDATRVPWAAEMEEALRSLRDVDGVSIGASGDQIREVHILSGSSRPAKQIVRDVQTLLLTRFNRQIDHRIVSVAFTAEKSESAPATAAPAAPTAPEAPAAAPAPGTAPAPASSTAPATGRIRFTSANVYVSGARVQAQVELRWKGVLRMGGASGWSTRSTSHRLIAQATLAAVQEFLDEDLALGLAGIEFTRVGRGRAVVVGLELIAHRETRTLYGSCAVGRDAQQAVVLATLAALNRVVGGLRTKEPTEYVLRPMST